MGNDSVFEVDKQLSQNRKQLVQRINEFYNEVLQQDKEMVPLKHVFLRKIKLSVCIQKDRAAFFKALGNLIKGISKAYAGGFDPDLLTDACEFISMVAGSSSGELQQERFYSVQKLKDSLIRVDIFTVAKNIKVTGTTTESKTLVANCFALSSIKIESLDENEKKLAILMKEYKEQKQCCLYALKRKLWKKKQDIYKDSLEFENDSQRLFKSALD